MPDNETVSSAIRIGDKAPDFAARSTAGDFRLSDCRGRWLILFSHPADFTPVCTSEFVALAKVQKSFEERGCDLAGISVDSLFSHYAWLRAIRDATGVEVRFPLIEDPTMVIGRAYGMIDAEAGDSATIRSSFFIDPDGIVRAMNCYPSNVGRSIPEMLRTLNALQAVHAGDALAPADWQVGNALLDPVGALDDVYAAREPGEWFMKVRKR